LIYFPFAANAGNRNVPDADCPRGPRVVPESEQF
jgi:hypothetical protein